MKTSWIFFRLCTCNSLGLIKQTEEEIKMNNRNSKFSFETLETLQEGEFVSIGNSEYKINGRKIFKLDRKGDMVPLTLDFLTIDRKFLTTNGELEYDIVFEFEDNLINKRITHQQIQPNKIGMLANHGILLNQKYTKDLSNALALMGSKLKSEKLSDQLGFYEDENKLSYRGVADQDLLTSGLAKIFKLDTKGTLEGELVSVKNLITGVPELELVYSLGFTSIVNWYLRKELKADTLHLLYFLYGDSSIGKTTALQAALSPFGCPDPRTAGSFVETFSSTNNALIHQLSTLNGSTLGIDDLGSGKNIDRSDFLYVLANGMSKSRSKTDGSLISGIGFEASVIGTGEFSIRDKLTSHGGQQIRCIEFKNLAYTTSQKHSEAVKAAFFKDYGHMATEFATRLIGMNSDELQSLFDDSFNLFSTYSEVTQTNKLQRYSKQLAVVLLSIKLLNKFFDFQFKEEEITRFLLDNLKETEEWLDYAQVAFGKLVSWILEHENQFGIDREKSRDGTNVTYGFIKNEPDLKKVYIESKTFKKVADEIGLPDLIPFIKELKQKGLVESDKDRSTKKIGKARYYVFILK